MEAIAGLIGVALAGAGIIALRAATRAKPSSRPLPLLAGWGALILSAWPWIAAGGAERGVALGAGVTMVLAGVAVAFSVVVRKARSRAAAPDSLDPVSRAAKPWRALWRFLAAGPLAGGAAFALAASVALQAGGTPSTRAVAAAYLMPLLWGAAMAWAMADEELVRVSVGLAAITALCAGALIGVAA